MSWVGKRRSGRRRAAASRPCRDAPVSVWGVRGVCVCVCDWVEAVKCKRKGSEHDLSPLAPDAHPKNHPHTDHHNTHTINPPPHTRGKTHTHTFSHQKTNTQPPAPSPPPPAAPASSERAACSCCSCCCY
jgi:hypothetical protein